MDPQVLQLVYLGIQASRTWLEFTEAAKSMTLEEALAHFEETKKGVDMANENWVKAISK